MSESDTSKHIFIPHLKGLGLNMGFGGSALGVEGELTFDMRQAYTSVGNSKQILQGDARDLSFLCDESVSWIHSAHLLEDFSYSDLVSLMSEWRRVLKPGGIIATNCPDQQRFLAHCKRTGQGLNAAHFEQDFSLENFKSKVLARTGPWKILFEEPNHGPYSWLLAISKL